MSDEELFDSLTDEQHGKIRTAMDWPRLILDSRAFPKKDFKPLVKLGIFECLGEAKEGEWFTPYTIPEFIVFRTYTEYGLTELGCRLHDIGMARLRKLEQAEWERE